MKLKANIVLLTFLLIFVNFSALPNTGKAPPKPGRGQGHGYGHGNGGPPPPPGLPIDAGTTMLLISGLAFGVYAIGRRKK